MDEEPQDLKMDDEGIREFVGYYAEKVRREQNLNDLEWDVGGRMQYAYFWLKSDDFTEPLKVALNIRRATAPLEDLDAIKQRIYTSFGSAARELLRRRNKA